MMRLAVISDIHGNAYALDLVLADLRRDGLDRVVCLGDAIQGGPQPAQTAQRLRDLACPVVMGNADAWLLTGVETGSEPTTPERLRSLTAVREWTLAQLGKADREFIAGFKATVEVELEGGRRLLCFHGSPTDFDEIILPAAPEADFQRILGPYAGSLLAGGHTHAQQVRRLGEGFFFNPGSVGFSFSHHSPDGRFRADSWADYAVLTSDSGRLTLEFRRLPFETAAVTAIYAASGRPYADEAIAQYQP